MQKWQTLADARFTLRIKYPAITPEGHTVIKRETERADMMRVHLMSEGGQEIYFEITQYLNLPLGQLYMRHRQELESRFEEVVVSSLEPATLVSRSAQAYSFMWPQRQRKVFLVEFGLAVCRILFNPLSPLNEKILATIEWTDQSLPAPGL